MAKVTIWHNPRCTKSRATLQLLHERGLTPIVIDYRENPPDAHALTHVLDLLQMQPRELMRRDEPEYAQLQLDDPALEGIREMARGRGNAQPRRLRP